MIGVVRGEESVRKLSRMSTEGRGIGIQEDAVGVVAVDGDGVVGEGLRGVEVKDEDAIGAAEGEDEVLLVDPELFRLRTTEQ